MGRKRVSVQFDIKGFDDKNVGNNVIQPDVRRMMNSNIDIPGVLSDILEKQIDKIDFPIFNYYELSLK